MHFRRMKEVGLSLARVFVIWDHIERKPGQWRFDLYDAAYDAAAANGIPMLTTLCPEDPPGWTHQAPFYHAKLIINTPKSRRHAGEYLRRVVERYKNHPAQGPWSLANEPGLPEWFDDTTMRKFGAWLKARYGSVERLNARWFRPFDSFDKVKISSDMVSGYWSDIPTAVDWKNFRIQQLCDQIVWIRDQVRRYDAKHPTHIHPAALAHNMPGFCGGDAWAEKEVVDFIGTTIHPIWQLDNYRPEDTDLGTAFITDVLRSASGSAPWWVTEMQSGPVLWTSPRALSPTPEQMTRWIWDDIGAGAKAVIFWCWHPRRFGREGGECGLVHPDGSSTVRSEAAHKITQALAGPAAFLHAAEPLPPRVAILYSRQSLLLYAADDPHATWVGDRVIVSLLGCHRALCERQIPVNFINEDGLKRGDAARYAVLYLPHCYALDDATLAALRRYVAEGGTLWADGLTAWKDDYGNVRPEMPGGLIDVFGVKVDDIEVIPGTFRLTPRCIQWRSHPIAIDLAGGGSFGEGRRRSARRHAASLRQGHGHLLRHGAQLGIPQASRSAGGRVDCRTGAGADAGDGGLGRDQSAAHFLPRPEIPRGSGRHLDQSGPAVRCDGYIPRRLYRRDGRADRAADQAPVAPRCDRS